MCVFMLASCSQAERRKSAKGTHSPSEELYSKFCKGCHGKDGDLRFSGAADLQISTLNYIEIILLIEEGKDRMPAYQKLLTNEEIILLAEYVKQLRNN